MQLYPFLPFGLGEEGGPSLQQPYPTLYFIVQVSINGHLFQEAVPDHHHPSSASPSTYSVMSLPPLLDGETPRAGSMWTLSLLTYL